MKEMGWAMVKVQN